MLNVKELMRYDTAVMVYEIKYGLSLLYLNHTIDEFHDTPVRNNDINFRYQRMSTETSQRSFSYIGAQV